MMRYYHQNSLILSSWYNTLKAKQIQPEDGLKKGRNMLLGNILYIQCNQFCCVLTASYVCLFSCRYNPLWLYFHSPVAGFSLLVFEVS